MEKYSNPHVRPLWRQAWAAKEEALRSRITRTAEALKQHSRPLRPLAVGERVFLQNQQGSSPNKWDRSGVVIEPTGHDQYRVKVDGAGRVILRNRRFLRAFTPASPDIQSSPALAIPAPVYQQQPTSTPANLPRLTLTKEPSAEYVAPRDEPTEHPALAHPDTESQAAPTSHHDSALIEPVCTPPRSSVSDGIPNTGASSRAAFLTPASRSSAAQALRT